MSLLLLAAVPLPPVPSQAYQFWLQIVTLLVAAFLTWDSRRTVGEARSVMNELKVQVNGRLSQLLETAKIADHAVGFEQGRATAAAESVPITAAAVAAATAIAVQRGAAAPPAA
jgi:hypothetical protein